MRNLGYGVCAIRKCLVSVSLSLIFKDYLTKTGQEVATAASCYMPSAGKWWFYSFSLLGLVYISTIAVHKLSNRKQTVEN